MKPKCLVTVNEISILERLIHSLKVHNFKRLVIVVGHQADCIRNFLGTRAGGMEITYITSPLYKTTNNIYSLWLARNAIDEPFLLLESDLVFDPSMLAGMLRPDRIAVAKSKPYMDGTTVTINSCQKVEAFYNGAHRHDDKHYKTVNIYSLSAKTWQVVRERLDQYISNNQVNGYYEMIFADMVNEGSLSFTPIFFDTKYWYEIDNVDDLRAAELICDHHLPTISPEHMAINPTKGLCYPTPAGMRLRAIKRISRDTRRHPVTKVVMPMTSTLPQ